MTYYRQVGDVPAKRHTVFTAADGSRYQEELFGHEGFASRSALLYHRQPPSAVVAFTAEHPDAGDDPGTFDHPSVPRHVRTGQLAEGSDMVAGRRTLLVNDQLSVGFVRARRTSELVRNALGDELLYIQSGAAVLDSVFGSLAVGPGDYVVIPGGTTHRWRIADDAAEPVAALVVESRGHVAAPARYLSAGGQFLEHAPFCERDLRAPSEPLLEEGEDVDVVVRTAGGLTRMTHRTHPFDVVGWDGALYPWALNIADFEPIVGRIHQPPPVHQTFEGPGFVVCSFVPRLYDFHPEAVKVPYAHSNVDSDEILFYSAGQFMSRAGSGIDVGSLSFHPAGFVHGPQPGSYEASIDRPGTDEVAVMIDTFAPLRVTDAARQASAPEYPTTWTRRVG